MYYTPGCLLLQVLCIQASWADKVYVGPAGQRSDLPWRERFLLAEADSHRTTITGLLLALCCVSCPFCV